MEDGKEFRSELAQVAMTKPGSLHNATGTLKEEYANGQELVDDAMAINFTHAIVVEAPDGSSYPLQQGAQPAAVYGELPSARLGYKEGPRTSTPVETKQSKQPAPAPSNEPVYFMDHGKGRAGWPDNPQRQVRGETHGLYGGRSAIYAFTVPDDAIGGIGQLSFANLTDSAANPVDLTISVNGLVQLRQTPDLAGSCPAPGYKLGEPDPNYPLWFRRGDNVVCVLTPAGDAPNDLYVDHRAPR